MPTGRFLKNLSELRREQHLTQTEAAARLNVSPSMLSHYEHGVREPGIDFLLRAAKVYDCSLDYLLGRTNDRRGIPWFPENVGSWDNISADDLSAATLNIAGAIDALSALYDNTGISDALNLYLKISIYRFVRNITAGPVSVFTIPKSTAQNLALALESRILADTDGAWFNSSVGVPDLPDTERLKSLIEEVEVVLKENKL